MTPKNPFGSRGTHRPSTEPGAPSPATASHEPVDEIAGVQDWRAEAYYEKHGCRWNQNPVDLVHDAVLPVVRTREAVFGMITNIEATPGPTAP